MRNSCSTVCSSFLCVVLFSTTGPAKEVVAYFQQPELSYFCKPLQNPAEFAINICDGHLLPTYGTSTSSDSATYSEEALAARAEAEELRRNTNANSSSHSNSNSNSNSNTSSTGGPVSAGTSAANKANNAATAASATNKFLAARIAAAKTAVAREHAAIVEAPSGPRLPEELEDIFKQSAYYLRNRKSRPSGVIGNLSLSSSRVGGSRRAGGGGGGGGGGVAVRSESTSISDLTSFSTDGAPASAAGTVLTTGTASHYYSYRRLHASSIWTQFKMLMHRTWVSTIRASDDLIAQLVKNVFIGLLIGKFIASLF
jgi:hypothetical protein